MIKAAVYIVLCFWPPQWRGRIYWRVLKVVRHGS